MTRYRLYHLQDFRLAGLDELEAGNDTEAAALAMARPGPGTIELWRGDRRVRVLRLLRPGPAPV